MAVPHCSTPPQLPLLQEDSSLDNPTSSIVFCFFVCLFCFLFLFLFLFCFLFLFLFFLIFINLSISYIHFDCYSRSWFPGQHPPPLLYGLPRPNTTLPPTITFTGGSVLAGPRASPSTGALTRLFIATYEVGAQGQSKYSL